MPPSLHLTSFCVIQNTKSLALGTSDGACHLLRLDSSSSSSSNSSSSSSSSSIPGALLRLPTPRVTPAPLTARPSVLLGLLQQQPPLPLQQQQQQQQGLVGRAAATAAARAALSLSRLPYGGTRVSGKRSAAAAAAAATAAAAAAAAAAAGSSVACLSHQDTSLEQLLLFSLRNGLLGGWDLRGPSPAFAAQTPPWLGAPSAQAVEAAARWLLLGTTAGLLLQFDLRMQLLLRAWQLQPPVPINQLICVSPPAAAAALNSSRAARGRGQNREVLLQQQQQQQQQQDRPTCCMLALVGHEAFPLLLLDLQEGAVITAYNTSCFADTTAAAAAAAAAGGAAAAARDSSAVPRLVPLPLEALLLPSACSNVLQEPRERAAAGGAAATAAAAAAAAAAAGAAHQMPMGPPLLEGPL
ncbi:PIK3R4 kinase-related protein (incomplete catalytic triad), putative [Eimeria brunetti]|uniref:PIK3R4 kinase-related protein (Incomplete catalytic triad), putative n=1 Tax=Eimeria brunetti TaxID=51314 RepID=U6LX66_9EIME|nr:PIK3R4 kinase-related protein (incomplete catalytic triad), putative [Eimeria brunetti]